MISKLQIIYRVVHLKVNDRSILPLRLHIAGLVAGSLSAQILKNLSRSASDCYIGMGMRLQLNDRLVRV